MIYCVYVCVYVCMSVCLSVCVCIYVSLHAVLRNYQMRCGVSSLAVLVSDYSTPNLETGPTV